MRKIVFKQGKASRSDPYPNINGNINGKLFAQIVRVSNSAEPWTVGVRTENGDGWKWTTFKVRFATSEAAKEWLVAKVDQIFATMKIRL